MSLAAIDWAQPWLAPYRAIGEAATQAALRTSVAAALQQEAAPDSRPVFVPQSALPAGQAYEAHIFQTGTVPTRDNLHDFFNGLVWLAFPEAKRRLNELQAAEIARAGIGATRGPLRDALTLFDENGAVLDAPEPLWQALAARDWHSLFVTQRALWSGARLWIFGHALLEKLATPRKALTAHVLRLPPPAAGRPVALDDRSLARSLAPEYLARKPFVPLPVLGVPGWWSGNAAANFYDDPKVFRPGP
ncbi:DUF3025 domain-containing protein [Variovorax paradoxus]|uniref:DUF3025 domain-containing protein n=1 Tax=Variovorax paradoxus TaxID=34073 RepID=UPI0029C82BAE|nr:DUF3025 domain-containing protein [Variovorax paradoxus]WPH21343.1 DUF3025 domain-containing protein [Variovorax paradoxus]